jgi:hypothetical protein
VKRARTYELHLMLRTLRHPVTSLATTTRARGTSSKKLDLSV